MYARSLFENDSIDLADFFLERDHSLSMRTHGREICHMEYIKHL